MIEELLTIKEVAERLRIKPDTVRERIRLGVFQPGVHFYRRRGMRPLFKWSAVITWLEEGTQPERPNQPKALAGIPMAKRYMLR